MYALVVTVFAAFLWMICCENDRKVTDKAIGETTVQSMRSGEKTVSLEQSDIPKIEIEDLTDAFTVILQYAPKDMLAGCTVDESFLMWFYAQYGRDAVIHIAFDVLDGGNDPDVWYEETGNSIHVLWLLYCRDSGFGQHELENVYWMQTAAASEMVFGFAGDINFAENWYTTEYMKEQPDGLRDCFSEDLLAQMQGVDVMIMNNEFTYVNKKGATSVYGKAYTFRADPQKAELLEIFGTDTVTLANNYGKRGLLSTLDVLDQEGIPYSGAGRNLKDASKIIYYVMNGRKVAFVSATQIERSKQYTKAIDLYNEMIKDISPKHNRQYLIDLLYEQADMYHKIGKDDLAISQYKKCISLNDSLRRSEYLDELAKMQIQHQEDKKALKIKELQLKVSHNTLWELGALLIISLLTCTFFGYIIYSRKKRNRFLRKAKERAEESDRMKSAFLSNINHEIRTPLNAIIGFSEILIDEEDEEQRRQYVNIIRENNGMLQQLIDGILSISNIESGTISFKFTNFSLSELMKEIRHIAPTKIPGTTNIEYSQGPDKKIKADRSYLGQALINLLLFSASRAPKGNIRFGYKIKDDTVSFFIQNTDLEISQEEISLLLDYRLLLQRWTKGVGMGVNLELAATKTLVKRMGGDLELVSRSRQGMVIYLIIPLKPHNSQQ